MVHINIFYRNFLNCKKRVARIILKVKFDIPSSEMFSKLNWLSIDQRCVFNRCILMYKIVNNCAPSYLINYFKNDINLCYSLRSGKSKNFVFKLKSTDFYKHSFAYSGIQLWNNLPESVKSASTIESFKHKCKLYI